MLRPAAIFVLLCLSKIAVGQDCGECDAMEFTASDGLNIEFSRYMGTWQRISEHEGRPTYMCLEDCQQLQDELIWSEGEWSVVDCRPDNNDACSGTHNLIQSSNASPDSCPDDEKLAWYYCTGQLLPGGGCQPMILDTTAKFTCV